MAWSPGQEPPSHACPLSDSPCAVPPPPRPAGVLQVEVSLELAEEPVLVVGLWGGNDGSQPAEGENPRAKVCAMSLGLPVSFQHHPCPQRADRGTQYC